ncbi:MAG: His/Gly/Thr/Pro-type tRNA ligase C-terminal domain-containing protein, partial [Actinomycetes bacterium]
SMKSQFKQADKSGAPVAILIGPDEMASGSVTIRALRDDREQMTIAIDELLARVQQTGEFL